MESPSPFTPEVAPPPSPTRLCQTEMRAVLAQVSAQKDCGNQGVVYAMAGGGDKTRCPNAFAISRLSQGERQQLVMEANLKVHASASDSLAMAQHLKLSGEQVKKCAGGPKNGTFLWYMRNALALLGLIMRQFGLLSLAVSSSKALMRRKKERRLPLCSGRRHLSGSKTSPFLIPFSHHTNHQLCFAKLTAGVMKKKELATNTHQELTLSPFLLCSTCSVCMTNVS